MSVEIFDTPFRIRLVGKGGPVAGECYGETGMALMNEMWAIVRARKLPNRGINHWVYLPGNRMFTGVELTTPQAETEGLETLEVEIPRYARHVHTGPYSELHKAWADLKARLAQVGERCSTTGLEIYGHWNEDPAKLETTILIGLVPKAG